MVNSRLALGSPGCLLVVTMAMPTWPHTQENGCWQCPSDRVIYKTTFPDQTRPICTHHKERGISGPLVQPVFCIVDTRSCSFNSFWRHFLVILNNFATLSWTPPTRRRHNVQCQDSLAPSHQQIGTWFQSFQTPNIKITSYIGTVLGTLSIL